METSLFLLLVLLLLLSVAINDFQCHGVGGGGHLHHSLATDKTALLAFKKNSLTRDPQGVLANWLDSSDVCNFFGVTCSRTRNRVSKLQLASYKIQGSIHPSIANLTRLLLLDLADNELRGPIPGELGSLSHLTRMVLGKNQLTGPIPDTLSSLSNLVYLDLRENHLSGRIPGELGSLSQLTDMVLGGNQLTGPIPDSLSSLSNLVYLDLRENHLSGRIPGELGSLSHLTGMALGGNQLAGPIPDSLSSLSNLVYLDLRENHLSGRIPESLLYNCTELGYVDLSSNAISGNIPPQIGYHLTGLTYLNLYNNKLTGKIPTSLANLSFLVILDVVNNNLLGELPSAIVGKLQSLEILHLSNNYFRSHDNNTNLRPFFDALANCSHLKGVQMAGNCLRGKLPSFVPLLRTNLSSINFGDNFISGSISPNIGYLSNLTRLDLSSNLLSGTIPEEITMLQKLEELYLSSNKLSGAIPKTVGEMTALGMMDLSRNQLSGNLPVSFGNLSRKLNYLFLQENRLTGEIPSAIGSCDSLKTLVLSYNRLRGPIPAEISNIRWMGSLNLSHNLLQGPLPPDLSKLVLVETIDLSSNNLSGILIPQFEACAALKVLNLSRNKLQGKLPDSFGRLRSLETLDVSYNQLTGSIPSSLNACSDLTQLYLSYNDFSGSIPTSLISSLSPTNYSFRGNPHLCGPVPGVWPCKRSTNSKTRMLVIVISSVAGFTMLVVVLLLFYCVIRRRKTAVSSTERDKDNKAAPANLKLNFPRITYRQLQEATGGFDEGSLIGSGGYGQVYKGTFKDGTLVAVKVLRMLTGNSTKSFNKECQVLKRIRHRNLIRIITACSLPDFKAVVLPFMVNGSLESHLYPTAGSNSSGMSDLSLVQRVNICSDVAEGMAYLHHHSPVRVIHCDLKPSNVLLNDDMTALVSDFGNARLLMIDGGGGGNNNTNINNNTGADYSMGASTANMLCGSIGYMAPEYGLGSNMSTKGDVYSYGVLVLEMVTGKRPTDDMFGSGTSFNQWVKSHYHGRGVEKVIDNALIRSMRDLDAEERNMWEVAVAELIELGLICTQDTPSTRPTMQDVADELDRLKRYLTGDTSSAFASSLGLSSSTVVLED